MESQGQCIQLKPRDLLRGGGVNLRLFQASDLRKAGLELEDQESWVIEPPWYKIFSQDVPSLMFCKEAQNRNLWTLRKHIYILWKI